MTSMPLNPDNPPVPTNPAAPLIASPAAPTLPAPPLNRRAAHLARLAEEADAASITTATARSLTTHVTPRRPGKHITEREAAMRRVLPHLNPVAFAAVQNIAIEAMLTVPKFSGNSDRYLLRLLLHFGVWARRNEGFFDPSSQLTEPYIDAFVKQVWVNHSEASISSAYSALRRIRDNLGTGEQATIRRGHHLPPKAPHTELEWARYEAAAGHLAGTYYGTSFRMLLDLTGEAGLRASEASLADGTWITKNGANITITAVNTDGVIREIPVIGPAANRLAHHIGKPEYLISPLKLTHRHNTISSVVMEINKLHSNAAAGYLANRARHRWLLHLASTPMRFTDLCAVADMNPGNRSLIELLTYAVAPHPTRAANAVRAALTEGHTS